MTKFAPLTDDTIQKAVKFWLSNREQAKVKYGHISNWDVSSISDMSNLFSNAYSFNDDLSYWDVSNVQNMCSMFHDALSFNQDLSSWDVSNVSEGGFTFMFETDLVKSRHGKDLAITEENKRLIHTSFSSNPFWSIEEASEWKLNIVEAVRDYREDGTLLSECTYKNGLKIGAEKFFTYRGKMFKEDIYEDGVLERGKRYYESGGIKEEIIYEVLLSAYGVEESFQKSSKEYRENGTISNESTTTNGKQSFQTDEEIDGKFVWKEGWDGTSKTVYKEYYQSGGLKQEQFSSEDFFGNGKATLSTKCYDEEGGEIPCED